VIEKPLTGVPAVEIVLIVFCEKLSFPPPVAMPITAPVLVILLITLFETVEPPKLEMLIAVIALLPPVMFENVLPLMIFVAPAETLLSVFSQPVSDVAPVRVRLEKLLLLFVSVVPATEFAVVV